jgi:hypothetical protein
MRLWAVYSDDHAEVDIGGDREGLRALASAVRLADPVELALDAPPAELAGDSHQLHCVRVRPVDSKDGRICFRRDGSVLVVSGKSEELSRIVGHAVADIAEGPPKRTGVGSHVHLDPTSDPERRYYAPNSGSLVVMYADDE